MAQFLAAAGAQWTPLSASLPLPFLRPRWSPHCDLVIPIYVVWWEEKRGFQLSFLLEQWEEDRERLASMTHRSWSMLSIQIWSCLVAPLMELCWNPWWEKWTFVRWLRNGKTHFEVSLPAKLDADNSLELESTGSIISYVPIPVPNAWTSFHNVPVRSFFIYLLLQNRVLGFREAKHLAQDYTSAEAKPTYGWSSVWLQSLCSVLHHSIAWLDTIKCIC